MNKRTIKMNVVNKRRSGRSSYIRDRMRIRRMKGGNTKCSNTASAAPVASNESLLSYGGGHDMTQLHSISPLTAGMNTRDISMLSGGRGYKKRYRTVRKIRFLKNKNKNKNKNKRYSFRYSKNKRSILKGGGGAPFFLPDDITNLKDSLIGGVSGAVNGYKGVDTPYQTNHTYPYQQSPTGEAYNSSITDANTMYNNADNYTISKY